ncbi:hypothetical protein QUA79_05605 [Microcoleus sp. F8-D1]
MSRIFFTPPQPSPDEGEGVRNSQMMRGLLHTKQKLHQALSIGVSSEITSSTCYIKSVSIGIIPISLLSICVNQRPSLVIGGS